MRAIVRLLAFIYLWVGLGALAHAGSEVSGYAVSWRGGGSCQAANDAQGFRSLFSQDGVQVLPRVEAEDGWTWALQWTGYGRGRDTGPLPEATLVPSDNRIEYRRGRFTEWYENRPDGIEQGFVLPAPPDGEATEAPLHLELTLTGSLRPLISEDGQAIDFMAKDGRPVLRYAGLRVTDARGMVLPSWMEGFVRQDGGGIRLMVDARDAVYPIMVDPLTTASVWTNESNQANAEFGRVVATAGDVNGDGYSDLLVGAPFYDNGQTDEGRVYLYLGSPSGLALVPAWTAESNQTGARFGASASTAGDVNGDGFSDVIIGAPFYDNRETDEGRAFVYLGSPSGLSATPAWIRESDQASANYGASVACAGDVDNDGYADVLVGAYLWDNGATNEGGAFLYRGSAAGLALTPVWSQDGHQANAWYGYTVATAGDVNGDGFADVLVGAPQFDNDLTDEGRAYLYLGNATAVLGAPIWVQEGNQTSAQFGFSVATAGDTNGDGYADILVGAWQYTGAFSFSGRAFLYRGGAAGPSGTPFWTADGGSSNAYMGYSLGTVGDVDADGYGDFFVTQPFYSTGPTTGGGAAAVFLGRPTAAPGQLWSYVDPPANAAYGWSAAAGDVNGDGYADFVVGAPWDENGQTNEGLVYLYTGYFHNEQPAAQTRESDQAGAQAGTSVAFVGDINGDGFGDFVAGAPLYDNGQTDEGKVFVYSGTATGFTALPWNVETNQAGSQFGAAVGACGDVNGDGYADLLVGAPSYDDTSTDDGRAYVFLGSPTGLATTPAWIGHGAVAGATFGASVGTAGDVNGDGYADFLVGAPKDGTTEPFEGRAFLFLGSPGPLSTLPAWTAESNEADARFGSSVATAGDVNRDGYADVLVGAPQWTNGHSSEGRASLYLGSASGLATSAVWNWESSESGGRAGSSVASAGDVNGDGYADVLIGTPTPILQHVDLFYGSPAGLPPVPSATFPHAPTHGPSGWGTAVSSAGDFDGDGFADILMGDPTYGWDDAGTTSMGGVMLRFGSAAGIINFTDEVSGENNARLGASVSSGDVTGDGYADFIVGSPLCNHGQTGEGCVLMYYGGMSGPSIPPNPLLPRARTTDDARPIARWGKSDDFDALRLAMLGRSPFGRGRVRLEWELKPLGTLFDGTGTGAGALRDTGLAGVALSDLASGLTGGTAYHWRVRVRYDPTSIPFAARSRWITVPSGGWNESMLRTASTPASVGAGRAGAIDIAKAGLGVTMSWTGTASCLVSDTDHAIYEGTLGNFTSHVPVTCTTAPGHSWNFTPQAGNRYFLLVPINATREGSYGAGVGGAERPISAAACAPQLVACP